MNQQERKTAVEAEQESMSHDEIADLMQKSFEYAVDLNNLEKQKHNWVDRGLKISCEGAGHPHHSHFKVRKPRR